MHPQYFYEKNIHLLGVRLIKNERTNFEADVQRAMSFLLGEAITLNRPESQSSNENDNSSINNLSSTLDDELPSLFFRIPSVLQNNVEFIFDPNHKIKLDNILSLIKQNTEELFQDDSCAQSVDILSQKLSTNQLLIPTNQLFLYRGALNSQVERCLSLTTTQYVSTASDSVHRYQLCFVLYADSPAQVTEIVDTFRKLHGIQRSTSTGFTPSKVSEFKIVMNAEIELKEEIAENKWQTCPREKENFKLRANLNKLICINLYQDLTHFYHHTIKVQRCFGILLSPGRNLDPSDMVAIGQNPMGM